MGYTFSLIIKKKKVIIKAFLDVIRFSVRVCLYYVFSISYRRTRSDTGIRRSEF